MNTATLAGGCFWCTESIFLALNGVSQVQSGYIGGQTADPDYRSVCTGHTGHAEAVQICFDPAIISYRQLLQVFFATHDPTTRNRQGHDVGSQYRSAIFYHDAEQLEAASAVMADLEQQGIFAAPIVTTLEPASQFYPAEDYHQQYFARNAGQPYCQAVIQPKQRKLRQQFANWLKP
ncbi:peptide-methionine (S)-S-oxide reductase MsrA [Aquitalea sp. LB_tupeE]|uniref:peptide-methionine (S)-S-oxide reductase MsrA n=1 Tax=Aquitalea sp. LB_tupeE TaxID=2748078 RepID=UPI0015BD21D8|nr:peptide-methionine (S)-S-oxide reductase MsrA [Aquitalea sp. LB_tupeE]NWK79566.1 peptide-methionine (S)-S-oxide reductase MsrA [Aquitalea sp. LB_tupeE]